MTAGLGQLFEAVEIRRQQLGAEIGRYAGLAPGDGVGLPTADGQAADLRFDVDQMIGIAHGRQIGRHIGDLVGQQVLVLQRHNGHVDAGHQADVAAPHACCIDDLVTAYAALIGFDGGDAQPLALQAGHGDALPDFDAAVAGALGQGLRQGGGIDIAVAGDESRAQDAVSTHEREQLPGFIGADDMKFEPEAFGQRCRAADFQHALR